MFAGFLAFFRADLKWENRVDAYDSFVASFGGRSFGNGLFRAFQKEELAAWEKNVTEAFPAFANAFKLFAYDWLGRCFGVDLRRRSKGHVLMFEIGTDEVLEIPCDFLDFLNKEIPEYSDACLASSFYAEWLRATGQPVQNGRCIGYKIPLFLGGEDGMDNLEDSDMDVYWSVITQVKQAL